MQRLVYQDTGPEGSDGRSRPSCFLKASTVGRGRAIAAPSIACFDKLYIAHSSPAWQLLDTCLFVQHPYPEADKEPPVFVSNLETWARCKESTEECEEETVGEWARKADLVRASFEKFQMKRIGELVDEVVSSFSRGAHVVSLSAPAGAGKSLLAAAIVKRLIAMECEGRAEGQMTRVEADRTVSSLTKSLQIVPSASNAASLARFSATMAEARISTVRGAVHSLCSVDGSLDAEMEGVEHVIVPYSAAEKLLEHGTFKMVILDHAHSGDPQITTCILKTLRSAAAAHWSSTHPLTDDSQKVDKVLVLYGVVDDAFEEQLQRMVVAASSEGYRKLNYEHIQMPSDDRKWKEHRFPVVQQILHAPGTQGAFGADTPLSNELARRLDSTEERLRREDLEICSPDATRDGLTKIPKWLLNRCALATKVLMRKFLTEAEQHMEGLRTARMEVESGRLSETRFKDKQHRYKFPAILVCVPSTGVARDVVKMLRFDNDDNRLRPFPAGHGIVQPYRLDIACARDQIEEKALTIEMDECPSWYEPGEGDVGEYIGKGRVIIAVNGAEAGLTIPNLGGIVELGMEWMRDGYTRAGLSAFRFFLTDEALAQQRLGRGGRTRTTDHILCLSREANQVKIEAKATVLCKLRTSSMNQVDFARQACEPALGNQPSLRSANWMECAVEARVNGTVHEAVRVGGRPLPSNDPTRVVYAPLIEIAMRNFPTLDPLLAQLLRAFVSNGLALHGVIRVAMLATETTALMKPSSGNHSSPVGPFPRFNSLDIFCKGIVSYAHNGKALKDYEGDSLPLVEMHAQLIKAVGWDLTSDVPDRMELLTSANDPENARAKRDNFWIGDWLPCGRVKWHQTLSERMDFSKSKSKEQPDAAFTYGRLVCDEERRKLWSVIRMLIFDLVSCGLVTRPENVGEEELNEHVRTLHTDPLLKSKGRALFALINTAFTTRFASVAAECRGKVMKARGQCKEYYQVMRADGSGEYTVEEKNIRAESIWNIRKEHRWLRFDNSSITRTIDGLDWHIAPADPVTDEQCALFANIVGRWRAGCDKRPDGETGFVEVELNATRALCGTRLEVADKKRVELVADLRHWLRSFLSFYPNRVDPRGDYAAAVDRTVELWNATSSVHSQTRAPTAPYEHFDD